MRERQKTADEMALEIMLSPHARPERLKQLAKLAKLIKIGEGNECPWCGCEDTEDNSCTGHNAEYRCCACDHRWGPGTES